MRARGGTLLVAIVMFGSVPAEAQQSTVVFTRTGSGARAAGMANAFIAVSDDGTAASWNPAGLAQLRKPELSVVSTTLAQTTSLQGYRTRDQLSAFTTVDSSDQTTYLDFASLAVPVTLWKKPTTFQAAWRRLYPLDFSDVVSVTRQPLTPDAPPGALIDSNGDLSGSVDLLSIAGAVKLTSRLALGVSYNFWRGDWVGDTNAIETPLVPGAIPLFAAARDSNRVRGDNFGLGLMLTYPRWSVGALVQTPLNADYENEVRLAVSDAPRATTLVEGRLLFPSALGFGAAWRPASHWTVDLDLSWDNWKDAEVDFPGTGRVSIFDNLPRDRTATRNTLSINMGAEHVFAAEGFLVPLRFGVAWEPQGARSPYTLDGVSYRMLAAGTGYNTNSLKFDAAFQYRWGKYQSGADFGVTRSTPELPSAVGETSAREWRLKFSLILRVTDTDKLRAVVRKVFGG